MKSGRDLSAGGRAPAFGGKGFVGDTQLQDERPATVRRQGFWDNRRRELTEALVHQVCHIRPLHLDEASGAV